MAGNGALLSDADIAAIISGKTPSKAGVQTFDAADKSRWAIQVDKDGKLVTGPDGKPEVQQLTGPGGAPISVAKGSTTMQWDPTANNGAGGYVSGAQTPFAVPAGASVYNPSTGKYEQAPHQGAREDSPAEAATAAAATKRADTEATTAPITAQAAATSSQAAALNAYVGEVAQKQAAEKFSDEHAKSLIDNWWKINVELPNTQQTQTIAAKTFADTEGGKAVDRAKWEYLNAEPTGTGDMIANAFNRAGFGPVTRDAFARSVPDLGASYHAEAMRALNGISPLATAVNGAPLAAPAVPAPTTAQLAGGNPAVLAQAFQNAPTIPPPPPPA